MLKTSAFMTVIAPLAIVTLTRTRVRSRRSAKPVRHIQVQSGALTISSADIFGLANRFDARNQG